MDESANNDFTVAEFLGTEIENIRHGPKNLAGIDPDAMNTIEDCFKILKELANSYGRGARLGHADQYFNQWATENRLSASDASNFLLNSTFIGSTTDNIAESAKAELNRSMAHLVRGLLLIRMQRDFLDGVSDLLKNRINQGLGSLRVQAENLALLRLMYDNHEIAREWLNADIGPSGRKFFRDYNGKLVAYVRSWNLILYHEVASTVALHSRISGVSAPATAAGGPKTVKGGIKLSLITGDTLDPGEFFLSICYFLRFYSRVFSTIAEIVPEVGDNGSLHASSERFALAVKARWMTLEKKFPAMAARWKKINSAT